MQTVFIKCVLEKCLIKRRSFSWLLIFLDPQYHQMLVSCSASEIYPVENSTSEAAVKAQFYLLLHSSQHLWEALPRIKAADDCSLFFFYSSPLKDELVLCFCVDWKPIVQSGWNAHFLCRSFSCKTLPDRLGIQAWSSNLKK